MERTTPTIDTKPTTSVHLKQYFIDERILDKCFKLTNVKSMSLPLKNKTENEHSLRVKKVKQAFNQPTVF